MHGSTTGGDERRPAETVAVVAERFNIKKKEACVIVRKNNMWELQVCNSLQAKDRKRFETVVWPSDWNHKESSALPTVSKKI